MTARTLVPVEAPTEGGWHDRARRALANASMLPASADKRFARHVAGLALHAITEAQWRNIWRLVWKYRRQIPSSLVPGRADVERLQDWRPAPPLQAARGRQSRTVADGRQLDLETFAYSRDWPPEDAPQPLQRPAGRVSRSARGGPAAK